MLRQGITYVAREVVSRALAVELAEAVADVAAALVVGGENLGLKSVGAGVAGVDAGNDGASSLSENLSKESVSGGCLGFDSILQKKNDPCLSNNGANLNLIPCNQRQLAAKCGLPLSCSTAFINLRQDFRA